MAVKSEKYSKTFNLLFLQANYTIIHSSRKILEFLVRHYHSNTSIRYVPNILILQAEAVHFALFIFCDIGTKKQARILMHHATSRPGVMTSVIKRKMLSRI